ncbi:type II secretion system F family protein [Paenibacillus sp. GCM10023252]|uniref:type II secretion system F family protein n=1 Tax=Paenibacillus sp. GCM10023252 TaxID=3252649 RepID=UPI00361FE1E3
MKRILTWCGWEGEEGGREADRHEGLTDYSVYRLSRKQFLTGAAAGYLGAAGAVYLFYHSIVLSLLLGWAGLAAPRLWRHSLLKGRQERLKLQFKEALYSLMSSLAAGRSVDNSFLSVHQDLKLLYPDSRTEVVREFSIIRYRLENGEPLEFALRDLARRACVDDITQFADVLSACKRTGGDLVEVTKRTSQMIGEKLEVQQEISVMMAQKRWEARMMMGVPFIFIGVLGVAAPDYMAPLYSGLGYVLITVVLIGLAICYYFIHRVMDIRI